MFAGLGTGWSESAFLSFVDNTLAAVFSPVLMPVERFFVFLLMTLSSSSSDEMSTTTRPDIVGCRSSDEILISDSELQEGVIE